MIGRFILSLATPCIAGIHKKLENLLEETIYRDYVYGKICGGSGPAIELLFSRTLKPSALARKQSGVAQAASKPGIFTLFIKIPGNPLAQHTYRPDCDPTKKNATHCSIKQTSRAIFYVACCSANHFCPIKLLNAPTLHSRPSLAAKRLQQAYRYVRTPEMRRAVRYLV